MRKKIDKESKRQGASSWDEAFLIMTGQCRSENAKDALQDTMIYILTKGAYMPLKDSEEDLYNRIAYIKKSFKEREKNGVRREIRLDLLKEELIKTESIEYGYGITSDYLEEIKKDIENLLKPNELKIFNLYTQGSTLQVIGDIVGQDESTIGYTVRRIYKKIESLKIQAFFEVRYIAYFNHKKIRSDRYADYKEENGEAKTLESRVENKVVKEKIAKDTWLSGEVYINALVDSDFFANSEQQIADRHTLKGDKVYIKNVYSGSNNFQEVMIEATKEEILSRRLRKFASKKLKKMRSIREVKFTSDMKSLQK